MNIYLWRRYLCSGYTIGNLIIGGVKICDTLEDADRGLSNSMLSEEIRRKKIYGETAIPIGEYDIIVSYSPKFHNRNWGKRYNGMVPLVNDVKGFEGIRIHPANKASEILGCIAVGENRKKGMVLNSVDTYYKLMDSYIMPAVYSGEDIKIKIGYGR